MPSHRSASSLSRAALKKRRLRCLWAVDAVYPMEPLECRVLLSVTPLVATSSNLHDIQNGPLAKAGGNLANLYLDYRSAQRTSTMTAFATTASQETDAPGGSPLDVVGNTVGVELVAIGSLTKFEQSMQALGMSIQSITPADNAIAGFLPITLISQVAQSSDVLHMTPLDKPGVMQEGEAPDQADQAMQAVEARSTYGLTGAGVTVGVISDSVNQVGNGLADSVAAGDLPDDVKVIQDGMPGDTDEGRAILEEIYDLAPKASLVFDTAGESQQSMANAVAALQSAGCNVIIDDIGFADEPFFQPGIIDQAIDNAVAKGVTYVTAAGNDGNSGFEQAASFVAADDGSGGAYINFNAGGTAATEMQITVTQSGQLTLEWDNGFDGVTGTVTADLQINLYNMNGQLRYSGSDDTFATGVPVQQIEVNPGTYEVQIEAENTPTADLPGYYEFTGDFTLGSTQYSGLRTSIVGHSAFANAISVAAVPFADSPPFSSATPIPTEDFTSDGPAIEARNVDGALLPSAITVDKPDISGTDGNNTSFFGSVTGDDPTDLPQFYGTSAAAGNVAGVCALLLQADPGGTEAQILSALKATAVPVNGQTADTYNTAGGYGLVDAVAAAGELEQSKGTGGGGGGGTGGGGGGGTGTGVAPVVNIVGVSPNPTSTPVSSIDIDFSQIVTGFFLVDLSLTVNGGANLLTSSQTLTTTNGEDYVLGNLSSLTTASGQFTLTLTPIGTGIVGSGGLALASGSSTSFVVQAPSSVAPPVPAGLTAVATSSSSIAISFSESDTSVSGLVLERSKHANFEGGIASIPLAAGSSAYTDSGLTAGTPYYYRIYAVDAGAVSAFSSVASAATLSRGEVILDNNSGPSVIIDGSWTANTQLSGYYGTDYLQDDDTGKGEKSVKFRPTLASAGEYFIYATWTTARDHAINVPFDVFGTNKNLLKTVRVNERATGGDGWVLLGEFKLHSSTASFVRVRNTGTDGEVIANAIEFLPAGDVNGKPAGSIQFASPAVTAAERSAAETTGEQESSENQLLRSEID
jgi:hypothetical protein